MFNYTIIVCNDVIKLIISLHDTNDEFVDIAGQYNDLATPFMSMPGETIRYIFSVEGGSKGRQDYMVCNETSACHFTPRSLGLLSAFYLMLMALASGVAVPGGLFMPSIMVGPLFT